MTADGDTRTLSSVVFNNDKFVDVVLAFDSQRVATTQEIARRVGINHDLAGQVIRRLTHGHFLQPLARVGGRRGALPYEVLVDNRWRALVRLAKSLVGGDDAT